MSHSHMGAWLTVNRRCNLRCGWCYARDTGFNSEDMSLGLANRLISFLKELGVQQTILIGGEPTIYPHLFPVIEKLIGCGITPYLVTNGKRFADKQFSSELMATGLKNVSISIKGADAEQYRTLTGIDCYDDVFEGYRVLRELGIEPTMSITIVSELIPQMERLLDTLVKKDITAISFDMGSPVIVRDAVSRDGIPNPRQLAQSCVEIYRFLKSRNSRFNIRVSIPLCLFPDDIRQEMIASQTIMTCCHIQAGQGLIFDQEGRVLPCNHFPSHPLGQFGVDFIDAETFKQFWGGDGVQEFRNLVRRYPSTICERCSEWDRCGGGCFLEWLQFDPATFIRKEVKG